MVGVHLPARKRSGRRQKGEVWFATRHAFGSPNCLTCGLPRIGCGKPGNGAFRPVMR